MLVYIENPKEFTKQLQEYISKLSKITRYKINLQKPTVFFYSSNKQYNIIKIPFIIASKNTKK